jgi:hypothetical protein
MGGEMLAEFFPTAILDVDYSLVPYREHFIGVRTSSPGKKSPRGRITRWERFVRSFVNDIFFLVHYDLPASFFGENAILQLRASGGNRWSP